MRPMTYLATAFALGLVVFPAAEAKAQAHQTGQQRAQCPKGPRDCAEPGRTGAPAKAQGKASATPAAGAKGQAHAAPAPKSQMRAAAPRAGDRVSGGKPFQRAANSRFKVPPQGQEYRVVNDYLVLMDSRTLQAVAVLGLLDSLTK